MTAAVYASHGRGGAGNIANTTMTQTRRLTAEDLQTPTLKTAVITTGRGGCGNMARNVNAQETRLRQDVEPVVRRPSSGAQHAGRGGAGNIFRAIDSSDLPECAIVDDESNHRKSSDLDSFKAKGKHWLFGKK